VSRDRFSIKVKHVSNVWWRCVCVAITYRMGLSHVEGGICVIWRTTLTFVLAPDGRARAGPGHAEVHEEGQRERCCANE
jgi:hypothetical protein